MLREKFIRYVETERHYSPHTVKAYLRDLDGLAAYLSDLDGCKLFEAEDCARVVHRTLRTWMGTLLSEGLGARSVARKISSVKAYFAFLQKSGVVNQNPARQLKSTRFEQKLPAFLKEQETERLFEETDFPQTFEGARDRCLLEMIYGCGLRRSELISLRFSDVDRYERVLRVQGKGNKERILPFGKAVAQAIEGYIEVSSRENISLEQRFFVRKEGSPLYPRLVYRLVNSYLSQVSSLRQRSPHVLRHTFATHLLDHGADLNAIKELLGHESLAATQVYTHNTISKLKSIHQQAHPRAENNQ